MPSSYPQLIPSAKPLLLCELIFLQFGGLGHEHGGVTFKLISPPTLLLFPSPLVNYLDPKASIQIFFKKFIHLIIVCTVLYLKVLSFY